MSRFYEDEENEKPKEITVNAHFNENHYLANKLVEARGPKFDKENLENQGCNRLIHALKDRFEMSWTENKTRQVMMVVYNQSKYEFMDEVRREWSLFEKKI